MKCSISVFVLLICTCVTSSQTKPAAYIVNGQVVEKTSGGGVPFATVIITNDSLKVKKAQACDASGKFTLDLGIPAKYSMTITSVGYKEVKQVISIDKPKTYLGKIEMEEGVMLKEVTVTAQKPLVKVDPDKIVYSMESDPDAQANNALEMLRKVPLITIDSEENITLNGQSNYKVLINGKSSTMMSSNLKETLKSLPANTIKDIEVITNPSSKYDAEGVGGIINIITARKQINGYNGSVSGGADARGSLNTGAYLAVKAKKLSFSSRYYGSQFVQPHTLSETNTEYFNNTEYRFASSDGKSSYKGFSNGYTGEASYDIDSLNLISLSFWGSRSSYTNKGFTENQYMNTENGLTRHYTNQSSAHNTSGYLSGNIDYQRTFKKPDKTFTVSYKLDNNPRKVKNTSIIDGILNYPSYNQVSENNAVGREQTIQADYYDPITQKHQVEGGLKFILRQNTSVSEIFRENVAIDNANDLDYSQYIMGVYAGYLIKWKKLSTKAGMRVERTWNDGISKTSLGNTEFTNRLFNVVPYVTFSFMPKQGKTLKLSYTQRLSRPGIWYLNPYVNDLDSLNISYGNPALKSEISHSFELGYTQFSPKFNFSATTSSSFANNSIQMITRVGSNGGTIRTYENIGKNQYYGLNLFAAYRPSAKVNISLNGGINYSKIEANTGYEISNEGFSYRASLTGRITLWKDASVSPYMMMYSSSVMLQGKSPSFYYTGLSLSQYFLKRKLNINVSTTDPFWPRKKYDYEYKDITFLSSTLYSYPAQNLRISAVLNFGKMDLQVKKARRGIRNDDLKSGSDSQGTTTPQP